MGGAGLVTVLRVETIGKICRRRLVHGESISAIAQDLGLSRDTVKRALRFEGQAFEYRRRTQPQPKMGPYLATPRDVAGSRGGTADS